MGPAPQLSAYQSAASSIYEPQKQAEQIQLQATRDTTKNALESQKGQVSTDYQSAIDKLTQSVQDQTGQINQLYSQRLGGNFSGLQGNDMGKMFARANESQSIIEQTRANKLSQITAGETNADIQYGAGVAALTPKYQSMESQYAQSAYGSAVKDYNTQQQQQISNYYKQQNLNLGYARFNQSRASGASAQMDKYKVSYKQGGSTGTGEKAYTGPNGSTNLYDYAANVSGGDKNQTYDTIKQQLSTGSSTDKQAHDDMVKLEKRGMSRDDIMKFIANQYSYVAQ